MIIEDNTLPHQVVCCNSSDEHGCLEDDGMCQGESDTGSDADLFYEYRRNGTGW